MSLVDRSFEEVCAIMDRTGDTVELLVEHAADFRMCDLLDEGAPPGGGGSGGGTAGSAAGTNSRKSIEEPPAPGLVPGKHALKLICHANGSQITPLMSDDARTAFCLPFQTLKLQQINHRRLRPDENYQRLRYKFYY